MYKILIVEDQSEEAEALRGHLLRYASAKGLAFQIETLPSALEFVNSRHAAGLVFMDIDMPGINGMEAAQILRRYDAETPLVFVTNLAQYAVRGYSVDALDFVVKPVEYHDFALRMDRAVRVMERNSERTLALPTSGGVRVTAVQGIAYVDLIKHDVCYHLASGEVLRERGSLRAVAERLPEADFVRISSGCLVNADKVTQVKAQSVVVADGSAGGAELFFSRSQRKAALEKLANYLGRSI